MANKIIQEQKLEYLHYAFPFLQGKNAASAVKNLLTYCPPTWDGLFLTRA